MYFKMLADAWKFISIVATRFINRFIHKISVQINDEILSGFEQLSPSFVVIMHLLVTNALNFTKSVAAVGNCVI